MAEPTCKCIMSAHCNPRRGDCKLKAGGTINAGGGVCAPAAMPERIFVRRDDSATGPFEVSSVADPRGLAEVEPGWHEYAAVAELDARDERVLDLEAEVRRKDEALRFYADERSWLNRSELRTFPGRHGRDIAARTLEGGTTHDG